MQRPESSPECRRGFTLVESVLSLAIASILMGSMISLILVASKSTPDQGRATDSVAKVAQALDQLSADLTVANKIIQATDKLIEFEVPDRDGDGKAEAIRYEWAGAGTDVVRSVGGGTKAHVLEGVSSFALSYTTTSTVASGASGVTSSPEAVVSSYAGSGLTLYSAYAVQNNQLIGQNIRPSLAASTRSWAVTRAQVWARTSIKSGTTYVQLRTTGADGLPTTTVLAETAFTGATLGAAYAMIDVAFANCPPLLPNQEVSLVLVGSGGSGTMTIGYATLGVGLTTPMVTGDGTTWSASLLGVIPHTVWATSTQSTLAISSSKSLVQVGVKVQAGKSPAMQTTINLPSAPGVS